MLLICHDWGLEVSKVTRASVDGGGFQRCLCTCSITLKSNHPGHALFYTALDTSYSSRRPHCSCRPSRLSIRLRIAIPPYFDPAISLEVLPPGSSPTCFARLPAARMRVKRALAPEAAGACPPRQRYLIAPHPKEIGWERWGEFPQG